MAKKKPLANLNWPATDIEMVPIKDLVPYARNARKHSPEQIAQIRASMREFGWTMPVLRDEKNGIIAGHGRVLAGAEEGYPAAPCITARGWSDAKKRAYVLADNKLTLNASWDDELLRVELQDLQAEGFDVALTGFGESEIDALLNGWNSDIDVLDKHGENLDGIKATIRAQVEQDQEDAAREVITKALDKAGISYEIA